MIAGEWEVCLTEIIMLIEIRNLSEDNYFFFLEFPNPSDLQGYSMEINSDVCPYSDACDDIKFSPHGLAEDIQSCNESLEHGLLKQANVHIRENYDKIGRYLKSHSSK